jgi:hypothetical protein
MRTLFALALLLTAAVPVAAADTGAAEAPAAIGSFVVTDGPVTLSRTGIDAPETAATAMPVHLHDVIETGADARAVVVFNDASELILGADSQATVDEYVFDPAAKAGNKSLTSVARGAFQFAGGLIGKTGRPDVKINIPYGSIGLRGTRVWGGTLDTYGVFVLDGEVHVTTKRGTVRVQKDEGTDLTAANAVPGHVKTWGQAKVDRAVATVSLRDEDREKIAAERARIFTAFGVPDPDAAEETPAPEETAPVAETPPPAAEDTPKELDAFGNEKGGNSGSKVPSALDDGNGDGNDEDTPPADIEP